MLEGSGEMKSRWDTGHPCKVSAGSECFLILDQNNRLWGSHCGLSLDFGQIGTVAEFWMVAYFLTRSSTSRLEDQRLRG